jgi:NAD-dependent SIR2 family protein deacetylase
MRACASATGPAPTSAGSASARSRPNAGHRALAELEAAGALAAIVTQNVDRLHQAAGSRDVVELHGALAEVRCLSCGSVESRDDVQHRMTLQNPTLADATGAAAPDGDAELARSIADRFLAPECVTCSGPLKPDVVFFGGTVDKAIVDAAYERVERAEVLLVLGTSLVVYSGFRFVRRAHERGIPPRHRDPGRDARRWPRDPARPRSARRGAGRDRAGCSASPRKVEFVGERDDARPPP